MLYSHANDLTRVLNKVQNGEYKIRVASSRHTMLKEVLYKAQDVPDSSLLTDPRRLRLLKEQIQALRDFEQTHAHDLHQDKSSNSNMQSAKQLPFWSTIQPTA